MESKINVDDINHISNEEFKNLLIDWIEDRGVSKDIQCKMRKDLFHNFNKTNLGRFISSKHQQNHRIMLSPLILVINTLVAEFLYSQNCHFSLSVFSAEVPYKNSLPDFENKEHFKFSRNELNDIYEALGIKNKNIIADISDKITNFYNSNCGDDANNGGGGDQNDGSNKKVINENENQHQSKKINNSLLYGIFNIIFNSKYEMNFNKKIYNNNENRKNDELPTKSNNKNNIPSTTNNNKNNCQRCLNTKKSLKKHEENSKYFKYLNKYLELLSLRIREMSNRMIELKSTKNKQSTITATTTAISEANHHKFNMINKNLEKLYDNIKLLNQSNKSGKNNLTSVIKCIDRLTGRLDQCSVNFHEFSQCILNEQRQQNKDCKSKSTQQSDNNENNNDHQQHPQTPPIKQTITYNEWIKELKCSKYGQKFIKNLETTLTKTFDNEKCKLFRIFEEKLENHKQMLRLQYKQKLLERLQMNQQSAARNESNPMNNEKNLPSIQNDIQVDHIEQTKELLTISGDHEAVDLEASGKFTEKVSKDTQITPRDNSKSSSINIKLDNIKKSSELSHHHPIHIDIQPTVNHQQQQQSPRSPLIDPNKLIKQQQEQQQFDYIVNDAKFRLKQLENESEKLDKSFQIYLRKQSEEKQKLTDDVQKILHNYNFGKRILNKSVQNRYQQQQHQLGVDKQQNSVLISTLTDTKNNELPIDKSKQNQIDLRLVQNIGIHNKKNNNNENSIIDSNPDQTIIISDENNNNNNEIMKEISNDDMLKSELSFNNHHQSNRIIVENDSVLE